MLLTDTIMDVAAAGLHEVLGKLMGKEAEGRTGGYLRIFTGEIPENGLLGGWRQIFNGQVGVGLSQEKRDKYWLISMEKALRLMKYHSIAGHMSSFQSRSDAWWEYQGAVYIRSATVSPIPPYIVLSFSGLPAYADEALCLRIAVAMGWADLRSCRAILITSENKFGQELLAV